jgi:hypothetical protein
MQIRRVAAPVSPRDFHRYGGVRITAGFYNRQREDAGSVSSVVREAIETFFC